MAGWGAVEKGLDELLSDPNACMKRLDLLMVCTAVEQQTRCSTPAGTSVLECLRCFTKTMQLLANMLSVRKRARWAQQEYVKGMRHTLGAATAVLQHPSLHANPVASGKMARRLLGDTELLLLVAAAQREVAQLLTAQAQQRQQQQQPLDNDQARLQMLGHRLLLWWLEAHQLWLTNPDRDSLARPTTAAAAEGYYAYHLQAVELAAAALQAAGPNCIPERFLTVAQVRAERFLTVAQVAHKAASCSPAGLSPAAQVVLGAHHTSAAYLRLVLTMVLVHSYRCNRAALVSLPGVKPLHVYQDQLVAAADSTSSSLDVPLASSSTSSSATTASQAPAEQQQQQQQQELQLLSLCIVDLWKQLGMGSASSLAQFAGAVDQEAGTPFTRAAQDSDSSSSSSCTVMLADMKRDTRLKALCESLQQLQATLSATAGAERGLLGSQAYQRQQALNRQHVQLLQTVCLGLPQMLLHTALLCGKAQPRLVSAAVGAATSAVLGWRAACTAAGAEWREQEAQLVMPEVLDSCLTLSADLLGGVARQHIGDALQQQQQQQQQQSSGLLFQVAATSRVVQCGSTAAQELRGAGKCKCAPDKRKFACSSSSSSGFCSVGLDCDSLLAVASMLPCLGVTKVHWRDSMHRGPAVLLLLEVLARRVLPHHITCSKSSSGQHSSAAGQLLTTLLNVAGERDFMRALFAASLLQPQLQPRVVALAASLHKLYRSKGKSSQLRVMHHTAAAARRIILDLDQTGVPDAIVRDLRTWRHMLAHWVVLLGRYCLEVGSWLQKWPQEQQQAQQRHSRNLSRLNLSSRELSMLQASACLGIVDEVIEVLENAEWLLGFPSLQKVRALWETCSTDPESDEDDDLVSISSGSGLEEAAISMGPEYARAWQQWQTAAGQQPVPAYGSLAGEFARLKGSCTDFLELCLSVTRKTKDRITELDKAGPGASASSSSSSSSSGGDDDDDSGVYFFDEVNRVTSKESWAAQDAISKAKSAGSAMQICINFSVFGLLGYELQAVGGGVCAKLPLPWLCNNPLCSSMGGASELQLVGGSSCVCGGCRVARYCGVACQAAHWEQHKPVCRELAAAAAQVAPAPPAGS